MKNKLNTKYLVTAFFLICNCTSVFAYTPQIEYNNSDENYEYIIEEEYYDDEAFKMFEEMQLQMKNAEQAQLDFVDSYSLSEDTDTEMLNEFTDFLNKKYNIIPSTLTDAVLPETDETNWYIIETSLENSSFETELNDFIEYAVAEGIIENTIEARAGVAISVARSAIRTAAGLTSGSLPFASELLKHSLQDNPYDRTFLKGTTYSNIVKSAPAFKTMLNNVDDKLISTGSSSYSQKGSLALSSPRDVYLALNKVNYTVTAYRSGGKWTVNVTVDDVYDYDHVAWNSFANAMADVAAYCQQAGVIVPYSVYVYVDNSW